MKKKYILIPLCLLAVCTLTVSAEGGLDAYKAENDPLVTVSYVDRRSEELSAQLQTAADAMKAELYDRIYSDLLAELPEANDTYEVVSLTKGQQLMADGPCEIILRSGSAKVVVTDGNNIAQAVGLSDVTIGDELLNGSELPRNHYVLIPRGDGRGVTATGDLNYFMVRGAYSIVQ